MIKHSETRKLSYSADQMFQLVADVESYPLFIPWCEAVRINSNYWSPNSECNILNTDMRVSFKFFKEKLTSEVIINQGSKIIKVEYIDGPFKFLRNQWFFENIGSECQIKFNVEFEFKSKIMQKLTGLIFQEAMKRIVKAFERRAEELYS